MKYSATTVFLPHLTLAQQAELLSDLGYDGIELRVRRLSDELRLKAEPSNWGYHVNDLTPENVAAKASEIQRILSDQGLVLAGLASNASCTDMEQLQRLIEGAVKIGAPFLRVGAAGGFKADGSVDYWQVYGETIAGYARVLELTAGTGVKVVLELHGNTIHPSASLAHRIVSQFDPADVGVIYDPQNLVRDGYETTALALQLLGSYVAHCHVGAHRPKPSEVDESGRVSWSWEGCPMGEGLYDFATMMKQLEAVDYPHFISVEDFRPAPPREKLAAAIRYLKSLESN